MADASIFRRSNLCKAVPRHDVRLAAKDPGCVFFHVDQFVKSKLTLWVVEKQINVGIVSRVATRGRAEQVKPFDAEPIQIGLVFLQSAYGFVSRHHISCNTFHGSGSTRARLRCRHGHASKPETGRKSQTRLNYRLSKLGSAALTPPPSGSPSRR